MTRPPTRAAVVVGPERNTAPQLPVASGAGMMFAPGGAEALAHGSGLPWDTHCLAQRMGSAGRVFYERKLGRDRSVGRIVDIVTR